MSKTEKMTRKTTQYEVAVVSRYDRTQYEIINDSRE